MAREASNELRKLRNLKKKSLDPLVNDFAGKVGTYQHAARELGPIHSAGHAKDLQAASEAGRDTVRNLRAEFDQAVQTLQQRATRPRHPASEITKSDILLMWNMGADTRRLCEWALASGRPDAWSSLREVLMMVAYANPEVYAEMTGVAASERSPQRWLSQQEDVILPHEQQVMPPEQLAAVQELVEVKTMQAYLLRNLDNVDRWLSDALGNGQAQRPDLTEWYTLEPQPESKTSDYVAYF